MATGSHKDTNIELLSDAINSFNRVSDTLLQYYRNLEEKVVALTKEVDHKKQILNSILDSIDIGVIFFDTEGIIKMINRAAEELINADPEEMIGRRSLGASIEGNMIIPEKGRPFFALISQRDVIDGGGSIIGSVLIFKDISRLKELEAINERNRRLTAMGELVMKIAHEIRNPLGSIELFAGLLQADLKDSEHGQYARRISNSVRSLVNTLDNMLSFAKDLKPKFESHPVRHVIEEIGEEFRGYIRNSKVRFKVEICNDYVVSVDKGLLRQALINLLINAVQAMPEGGDIILRVSDETYQGIRLLNVSLVDSGVGIEKERLSSIFEPFFSTKDRGTGLGLSIAASIINAHKGSISVESLIGKGTTFIVKIPFEQSNGNGGSRIL